MKVLSKVSSVGLASLLAVGLMFTGGNSVSAYSDTNTEKIPQLSGNSIQSNVWMTSKNSFHKQSWEVSAKFLGTNPSYADWVKTAWTFKANGLGVSIGGVSGGTASGNTLTGTWTNTNAWISDYGGSYNISGLPITGSGNNTASFLAKGVKRSATASIFRFY